MNQEQQQIVNAYYMTFLQQLRDYVTQACLHHADQLEYFLKKMKGCRDLEPYVALFRSNHGGCFELLKNMHMGCADAFKEGKSYLEDGDRYALDLYPVILERVCVTHLQRVFAIKGMLMIGIRFFFLVGYLEPVE